MWIFQSTSSARRTTQAAQRIDDFGAISIHVLREEDDNLTVLQSLGAHGFQSTSSARRTTVKPVDQPHAENISIHVLREEDDFGGRSAYFKKHYFNPRPPRGGRPRPAPNPPNPHRFRSTSSARRTTECGVQTYTMSKISIHVLREEDDCSSSGSNVQNPISIHVLREEDDCPAQLCRYLPKPFQSTSSARRTTKAAIKSNVRCVISIHVLREEDDTIVCMDELSVQIFQSTSSARRTTS